MKRYEEIDSLRGLAALTVLLSHFMAVFDINSNNTYAMGYLQNWYKYSPIHILWAGHEAVLLFFILSGFVLTLPFMGNHSFSYRGYLVKRFFRIYIACIVSVFVALALKGLLDQNDRMVDSAWMNTMWDEDFSISTIINHFLLIGAYSGEISPVIWSLVYEMRISIIFPIIVYFVLKYDWKKVLLFALLLSAFCCILSAMFSNNTFNNLLLTGHYTSIFIVGSLLAKHHLFIIDKTRAIKRLQKYLLLITGVLIYTCNWLIDPDSILHNILMVDWTATLGASIFIILSVSSPTLSKLLKSKTPSFFGKISYSLYLYHLTILMFFIKYDTGLPIALTLLLTFIVSVLVATVSYQFVEIPSMKAGKTIANRLKEKLSISKSA
ncbi:acyltransferase [Bacillaceae bacterium CLA-AA-H227]|uniref:Acyltransferase n=1 Tax=Robertmurraya yapensis (ex Hitch et al 2024) TaxID=3133160 RepID=A0ACC6SBP8_9BACI